jgi:hypothetical protein
MNKELVIHEAKDIMTRTRKQIKKIGFITPSSIVFTEEEGLFKGLILPIWVACDELDHKNIKQAHFEFVRRKILELNAVGVIHIGQAWVREGGNVDNKLPPSQDPNRTEALMLIASKPGFSLGIVQPFSRLGERVIFGEESHYEVDGGGQTAGHRCFIDVWDSDEYVDEVKTSVSSSMLEQITIEKE